MNRAPSAVYQKHPIMLTSFQFPTKNDKEKKKLITAIHLADWKSFEWKPLKALYKKLEQDPDASLLAAVLFKLDKSPFKKESEEFPKFPTNKSLAYMKRRGARFLQKLAKENPDLYLETCLFFLTHKQTEIDFDYQWISAKILYGNTNRFLQKRHGRGRFVVDKNKPNVYRTEERNFELWNTQPNLGYELFYASGLAAEVYEFALKLLSRNRLEMPKMTDTQLVLAYQDDAPWLQKIAAQQYFLKIKNKENVNPKLLAFTYVYSSYDHRITIENTLQKSTIPPPKENIIKMVKNFFASKETKKTAFPIGEFANMLLHILGTILEIRPQSSKRIEDCANFLSQYYKHLAPNKIRQSASAFLNGNLLILDKLIFKALNEANPREITSWLENLTNIDRSNQLRIFKILEKKMPHLRNRAQQQMVFDWCQHQQNPLVADFGWYVINNWQITEQQRITRRIFSSIWWQGWKSIPFQNALKSDFGAAMFLEYHSTWLSNIRPDSLVKIIEHAAPRLRKEAKAVFLNRLQSNFFNLLPELVKMEEERDHIFEEIRPNLKSYGYVVPNMSEFLTAENTWIKEKSWIVFTEKMAKSNLVQQVIWQAVYRGETVWKDFLKLLFQQENSAFNDCLLSAFSSMIKQQPVFVKKLVPVFGEVTQSFDNETLMAILNTVDEATWEQIQSPVLTYLKSKKGTTLWLHILRTLNDETAVKNILTQKIESDETIQKTLLNVDSVEVLDCHNPAFESLLLNWVIAHTTLFQPNSPALLTALTHRLPKIRNWAMEKVNLTDFNLSFALQLMESGLPESAQFAQDFFNQTPKGTQEETDHVLALLDSPDESTRQFGQTYFDARKIHLNNPIAIACLTEHTDPKVQAHVAESLDKNIASNVKQTFDRAVLRSKNRARTAKELVKKRVEKDLQIDYAVLIELAHGQNVKDREWAIEQLMKLTLSGVEIPEFTLA